MSDFKPESLKIKEIFGNQDSFYEIPRYQRPYRWIDEQVEQLWDDLYDAFDNEENSYFLGSIVTVKQNNESSKKDVVDGQQRLTTLMILFCVIRDLYPTLNGNSDDPQSVDIETLENFIFFKKKFDRLTLLTDVKHREEFKKNIIEKGNISGLKKPYKYEINNDEEPKYKFINTAVIFKNKLEGIHDKVDKFIDYIANNVYLIRIDCETRSFAIKLFQVINDRGMDLTASDLIKSFLLQKISNKYENDEELIKEEDESFITTWREIESEISDTDLNMNELFRVYLYYLLGEYPKKGLSEELESLLKDKDSNKVIHDLKEFANKYKNEIYLNDNKVLNAFWYLKWTVYWKAILMTALHTNYIDYERLTFILRRFYYLYWIAGFTLSKVKTISFNLIQLIKDKKDILEIEEELNKKLRADKTIIRAKENLKSSNIYGDAWTKALYILIEYNQTDSATHSFIHMNKELHIEHILPKGYSEIKDWNHITENIANKYLNSGANLTLLSGKKNIEASNNSFKTKIDIYKGKGKYKQKNEKITSFLITQKIVNDYNQKIFTDWNTESMEQRFEWFMNEVDDILKIK